ncbi:MAG TPA: hypothetical protein VF972_03275 [Actinomycetota bacterium]
MKGARTVRSIAVVAAMAAAAAMAAPAAAGRAPSTARAPVPGTSCTVFPSNNVWNTDISTLPVDARSATWLATMQAATTDLHPDFGPSPYGLPFAAVDDSHQTESIQFTYADESDPGPYPFGPDIPLERGSDRHALMVNAVHCVLYELYAAYWNNGSPHAGSGAIFDLTSNALRPDAWTSADAAGLPILPGLVRYDEVQAGAILHAIRFTTALTDCHHLWPARHDAGTCNSTYPPMGARFRLKATYGLSGFSRGAKVILRAMKRYGLILADNGSNWFFQGTMDSRWTDRLLNQLKQVPASAFEAVDQSCLMVDPNSAQADPTRC